MTYDSSKYGFDRTRIEHQASLADRAVLYRLASIAHSDRPAILNGLAPTLNRCCGRLNEPDQLCTYCANNVLVCIAEVLFHMYRDVVDGIHAGRPHEIIQAHLIRRKHLVVFSVRNINDLVFMDSEGVRDDFEPRVAGTTTVFPDARYNPFVDLNRKVRAAKKEGIYYPSARHSQDLCVILFGNKSDKVYDDDYTIIPIELRLVTEDHDPRLRPAPFGVFQKKIHATMGYYEFLAPDMLEQAKARGIIYPGNLPQRGMVDFVRRYYGTRYPLNAILPVPSP
jgi:hypothetical protein